MIGSECGRLMWLLFVMLVLMLMILLVIGWLWLIIE